MRAIRKGTKANKFTVDAVLHSGVYYLPSTMRSVDSVIKLHGCYYDRYRGKWLEDTFTPDPSLAQSLVDFAQSKGLYTPAF